MKKRDNKFEFDNDYKQLLSSLTKKELNAIRKEWGFKGISSLNKAELAEELNARIPQVLQAWLEIVTITIYDLLKELLAHDGFLLIKIQGKRDMTLFKYLQGRGVVFYKREENEVLLHMPDEIKDNISYLFSFKSVIKTKIKQNTEISSITIGLLVYYGCCPITKITEKINKYIDFQVDTFECFSVVYEFARAFDIIRLYQSKLFLKYVIKKNWVLEELNKRQQLDYYQIDKDELLFAAENLMPPLNKEYKAFADYLKKNKLNNKQIDDILLHFYLDVNNDRQLYEIIPELIELIGVHYERDFNKINDLIVATYNNTRQWVLKGNTPVEVTDAFPLSNEFENNVMESQDSINNKNSTSQKGTHVDSTCNSNFVNLVDFRNNKKEQENIPLSKNIGRNDLCPCGSGKKYKKCCLRKEQQRELLLSKLDESRVIDDRYFSRTK